MMFTGCLFDKKEEVRIRVWVAHGDRHFIVLLPRSASCLILAFLKRDQMTVSTFSSACLEGYASPGIN